MKVTLSEFRKQADAHGICEMSKDWDRCLSNKQRIDLALSARGLGYVAKAVAEGWGISPDEICSTFAPFNNGKYVRDLGDGYTSALYCGEDTNEIFATETALLVIDFVGDIYIPENRICEIHLVNSKCYIVSKGKANVYVYGDTKIINESEASIKVIRQ